MFSGCRMFVWFISVSRFLYRLDRLSRLNGFTPVMVGALYSLLFGVNLDSLLKTVPWPIMVYFYKLWLGWRVASLELIPHLLSISTYLFIRFGSRRFNSKWNMFEWTWKERGRMWLFLWMRIWWVHVYYKILI